MKYQVVQTNRSSKFSWTPRAGAVVSAAVLLLAANSSRANQTLNTFDTGLGSWSTTALTSTPGFNLGWSNTGLASGTGGEVGGLISRLNSTTSPSGLGTPRILDTVSFAGGNTLSLNSALSVSGKLYLQDISAASDLNFGYFNIADSSNQRAVLRIISPATAGSGIWRFRFGLGGSSGTRVNAPDATWNQASLDFNFLWTPSGLNDGSGTLSGSVANGASILSIPSQALGANTAVFDSFGLWVDSAGTTDSTKTQYTYFDNVQYTVVPEPTALSLFGLFGGLAISRIISRKRAALISDR